MCNKVVDVYPSVIQFIPKCFETQEICDKSVDTCPFALDSTPDRNKLKNV